MEVQKGYTKKQLRAYFKQQRSNLDKVALSKLDQAILDGFRKIPISRGEDCFVFSYLPIPNSGEVLTAPIESYLQSIFSHSQLRIAYPKTNLNTLEMEAIVPRSKTDFHTNRWGLIEPTNGEVLPPSKLNLVLLPLLCFDLKGNRVGYGKGFYDRYLANCPKEVLKIGLCYFPGVTQITDVGSFDIPLDYAVTPDKLYEF